MKIKLHVYIFMDYYVIAMYVPINLANPCKIARIKPINLGS